MSEYFDYACIKRFFYLYNYIFHFEDDVKEEDPAKVELIESNSDWFKEYLQKEQEIDLRRLEQQGQLLNITQQLLQDMNTLT